jgi:hypothetical protein
VILSAIAKTPRSGEQAINAVRGTCVYPHKKLLLTLRRRVAAAPFIVVEHGTTDGSSKIISDWESRGLIEYPQLIERLRDRSFDIVLGSRFLARANPASLLFSPFRIGVGLLSAAVRRIGPVDSGLFSSLCRRSKYDSCLVF